MQKSRQVELRATMLESVMPFDVVAAGGRALKAASERARNGFRQRFLVWATGPDRVGWIRAVSGVLNQPQYSLEAALHGLLAGQSSLMMVVSAPAEHTIERLEAQLSTARANVEALDEDSDPLAHIELGAWDINARGELVSEDGHEHWSLYCAVPEQPGAIHMVTRALAKYDCWIAGFASNIGSSVDSSILSIDRHGEATGDYCIMHYDVMVPMRDREYLDQLRTTVGAVAESLDAETWSFTRRFQRDLSLTITPTEREGAVTLVVQGVGRPGLIAALTGALPKDVSIVASVMAVLEGHTSMSCVLDKTGVGDEVTDVAALAQRIENSITPTVRELSLHQSVSPAAPNSFGRDTEASLWHLSVQYQGTTFEVLHKTAGFLEELSINIVRMRLASHRLGIRTLDCECAVSSDDIGSKTARRLHKDVHSIAGVENVEWYPYSDLGKGAH